MRPISREDAIRLCESHPVLVEFNSQGLRAFQQFTRDCPFYLTAGPYDFRAIRYFLASGFLASSFGKGPVPHQKKPSDTGSDDTEAETEEWVADNPAEAEEKPPVITVKIMAEDGKAVAPKGILSGHVLKLKAVPSEGSGTYAWKAKTKAIKVESASSQIVSVSLVAGQREAPAGEVVELTFTPTGQSAMAPQSHTLTVVKVLIMKNDGHAFGYDEYSEIAAKDQNWKNFQFKPDSKLDLMSIRKGKTGLADLHYTGCEGRDLFFKVADDSACECKPKDPAQNPILLEILAKDGKYKETRLEVRYGSEAGPVVAELDVAIMTQAKYKAKYFRVEDPDSPGTALKVQATPAKFEEALKRIYNSGMAEWKIEGETESVKSKYDIIRNGALDIEPGAESEELKKLKADCEYDWTRIIHVHQLRWSYYLAADAGPKDTKIKLKNYGRYLDFVGTNQYTLEDTSGKSVTVNIKSVDRTKAEFELSAPLGVELKTAKNAALLWPLGGLSGDPTLVSDFGGLNTLVGIVAHELGHSDANLKDIAEIKNIMHGVAEGNEGLRGRELPLFYHPDKREKQWAIMPGRT